jgi:excisionase family DNA binding protein
MSASKNLGSGKEDQILTTRQVADLLGVAVSTAQQWIESGALSSWKTPGGHRRVKMQDVLRLVKDRSKQSTNSKQSDKTKTRQLERVMEPTAEEFLPSSFPSYLMPANEADRLKAVEATNLVGTASSPALDRLTWLTGEITNAPMVLITLLTARRQWFISRSGVQITETPREWAFCSHAILQDDLFVVEDAAQDDRFRENPLVTGEPHIRFYAGIPLEDDQGFRMGTLCVLDREPRKLREREKRAFKELAVLTSEELMRHVIDA